MPINIEQFHQTFFDETEEHLGVIERVLLDISIDSPDSEQLNTVFRSAHSVKGGSGIFGFDDFNSLTHVMESVLDNARNGALKLTQEIIDCLLNTNDVLRSILESYRSHTQVNSLSVENAILKLKSILDLGVNLNKTDKQVDKNIDSVDEVNSAEGDVEAFGFFGDLLPACVEECAAKDGESSNDNNIHEAAECNEYEPLTSANPLLSNDVKQSENNFVGHHSKESKTIRVDTTKVDLLVNLIGELVITQSTLSVRGLSDKGRDHEKLRLGLEELERNTRDLQEAVMSMRMLPISSLFNRFHRLVRDLSVKLSKQVELIIKGADTEIDKALVEVLVDPITHLVRNSIDHGIETCSKRLSVGKNKAGIITLSAEQRSGNIRISIEDDGAGLNREKILKKAIESGISVSKEMKDNDVWSLIFEPGFSTADHVSDISGRGVGMDVVRRNIERIGGRVSINSKFGYGSKISITVPLTLAIVDGMCLASGEQIFVIPLMAIIESIQPTFEQLRYVGNQQLLWSRGKYWPIVDLGEVMQVSSSLDSPMDGILILVEANSKHFALLVDKLLGQQQVVIKSLEKNFRKVKGASGATIMGDGQVAMILDVESLSENIESVETKSYEQCISTE